MRKRVLTVIWCWIAVCSLSAADFVWKTGGVYVALDLLNRDCEAVLSQAFSVEEAEGDVYIGTWGKSKLLEGIARKEGINPSEYLGNHPEAFFITVLKDGKLLVAGSDKRGTAYGVLELSRMLGVSPWEWWADVVPDKKQEFRIAAGFTKTDYPLVPYRGIFINDEDWGLMPWSYTNYEPSDVKGQIGPKTHARIFELLLRLRANTFWPAMHECSVPFFFTEGNKEMADKYAIYLGTSHCEPMMRNTNGEWRKVGKGEYNYLTNRENVLSFWEERVKLLRHSDDIYTLGMRGVHDSGMLGAKTVEDQKKALTQIIEDQRKLLAEYKGEVTEVPQVLIPYKEVLDVYEAGLEVPEDVTLMWCDDNYGYITHFPTEEEAARPGGNGIYYHVSYWGRPHDYLWLSTASPYLIYQQMKTAYDKGIRKMWILNVGDIKPAEYQTELFMDMAWNIHRVEEEGVTRHLGNFLAREFGAQASARLLPMMQEHYRLAHIRKPEFMVLEDQAEVWSRRMPEARRDAYYQLVQYPVQGAAEMNKKCLYAQLARHGKADWKQSGAAFDSIVSLTRRYNTPKWKGIMDYKPRNLAVFLPIPETQTEASLPSDRPYLHKWNALEATGGTPVVYEGLGYEGMAAGIAKGESLAFSFDACPSDSVEIELRFVPTHPVDGKDLRIRVEVDGKQSDVISYRTYGRSEEWKQGRLTNQTIRRVSFPVASGAAHKVSVKALDEGVVLDQVYVYED